MDIVTTSLDALLQRATNPANQNVDIAAVEAFCVLITKEKEGSYIGVKLISSRLHSKHEKEVLQTLNILDTCMQKCGSSFQSEVGKFRFLNEMIKLVSPKYLGLQTPASVRQKVLQLMYLWTLDYPKESKIRDAYEMLRKQGVIKDPPVNSQPDHERPKNSIFCDEEKSKLLQKLLQSKNPEDLHAANRLIKCMVKEDDKRAEMKNRKILEIESVYNNVRLLKEMLDSYRKNGGTSDDLALIRELYQNCERLKPKIIKIASESQHTDDIIATILNASDELGQVIQEYEQVVVKTRGDDVKPPAETGPSLLDLDVTRAGSDALLPVTTTKDKTQFDVLCDIFSNTNSTVPAVSDEGILKPISLTTTETEPTKINGKLKAFEELDALGETLLKQNLQSASRQGHHFQKNNEKIPMNLLTKNAMSTVLGVTNKEKPASSDSLDFDLTYLLEKSTVGDKRFKNNDQNGDDLLVDISDDPQTQNEESPIESKEEEVDTKSKNIKESPQNDIKIRSETKLSDIFVSLESVKPSTIEPVVALEEKNGISVTLHFARDRPRDDVIVIVVTIVSKNELPLKNILFRAIVPKVCKVKLQPPSGTELPAFNPFLPPSVITQIMLISNPENVNVSLKFIVSYNIDDETTTEMGEVDRLPNMC